MANQFETELNDICPELLHLARQRDSTARLLEDLPKRYTPREVARASKQQHAWELAGLLHLFSKPSRPYEALQIFWSLYLHMIAAQEGQRAHKGMPLCWMSDCFQRLGCSLHEKRFLMLTLCEDAITGRGEVSPYTTGAYHRLVWTASPDPEFHRYARQFFDLAKDDPKAAMFPEALLQSVDDEWQTLIPSEKEAFVYFANPHYVRYLLNQLGASEGKALERLAAYLMSCMPGCRTRRRARTGSSDHDVVCSMEGFEVDFRSELGRYFVCECKDWEDPADFTTMAKFCRVLDSFKARFGILFSRSGITGKRYTTGAALEQLKVFQDRGIVIVVLDLQDLESVAKGKNLINVLRGRYEAVRLDIRDVAARKKHPRPKASRKK
jgi:hypothetical protein